MKRCPIVLAALLGLTARPSPAAADQSAAAARPPVVLPGVRVNSHPWTCFGLSFAVLGNRRTRQVSHLIIWRVAEHSEAAFKGIKPGDEILEADDRPVASLTLDFAQTHNRFRELFINRKPGDRIRLELIHPHASKPFVLALTEGGDRHDRPSWAWRR